MNCLERYRGELIRGLNRNLKVILRAPDETAIHDFRVGIKRVTALYRFLHDAEPNFDADAALARYRGLFKACGLVRDLQIARGLLVELESDAASAIVTAVDARIADAHAALRGGAETESIAAIRLPTIRESGVDAGTIERRRARVLASWRRRVLDAAKSLTARCWHRKRIRLKRYRHALDAFQHCHGMRAEPAEIEAILPLEQALGDWHDRVVAADLLRSLDPADAAAPALAARLSDAAEPLLADAAARLEELSRWHAQREPD